MATGGHDSDEARGRRIAVIAVLLSVGAPLVGLLLLAAPDAGLRLLGLLLVVFGPLVGTLLAVIALLFPGPGRYSALVALVGGLAWIGTLVAVMASDIALVG